MKGKYLEVPEFEGNCPDGCFPHRGNHTILRAINPAMFTCHRQDVVGSIDHAEVKGVFHVGCAVGTKHLVVMFSYLFFVYLGYVLRIRSHGMKITIKTHHHLRE